MLRRRCRILLVEDNPADIRLLEEAFKSANEMHELHTALDGEEALRFIHRQDSYKNSPRPDLILLDINLPKVSGYDVLTAVKTEPALMRIPVIMLTSSDKPADVQEAYNRNANAYLQKPKEFEDYVQVISELKRFWLQIAELPRIPA